MAGKDCQISKEAALPKIDGWREGVKSLVAELFGGEKIPGETGAGSSSMQITIALLFEVTTNLGKSNVFGTRIFQEI